MNILVEVVLPLSLAVIMLSLGVGLTPSDFGRVAQRGWVFAIGALLQIVLIPCVAFVIISVFGITGELAAGIMLLSFCPGGVTSNVVTRLAKGDVALSVSLTAVVSLISILTVPLLIGWTVVHFMGADAPRVSVAKIGIAMCLITAIPVAIGMVFRAVFPGFAIRIEPLLLRVASGLFVLIILAAIAANWTELMQNIALLGPAMVSLNFVMVSLGLIIGLVAGLSIGERKTIAIELGLQNGTLGIALAPLIVAASASIPAIGLPSAVYGATMYLVVMPLVFWLRRA